MAEKKSSPIPAHQLKVLLIDDQPMIGEAVRRMLLPDDDILYQYLQDPTRAMEVVKEFDPTVILQDLVMPQMDGMELVKAFRNSEEFKNIPLIVLSTKEDPKIKAEGFAAGANDYLVKLPDRIELVARIRYHSMGYINLLERNEAYRRLESALKNLEVRNQFIRKVFGRYLTDEVVENILESPDGLKVGGERREITVLMTDLRGFSALSETLQPEQVVSLLNNYLGVMTDVIIKYEGTIDEFIGDAILVVFGAPIWKSNHAERAVACALEMQNAMEEVNRRNFELGFPEVEMGIGINTGEVVVGNIGSEKRAKYGVVGREVNLASRIETYTVGGQILISESVYKKIESMAIINQEMVVEPKGTKKPITIYDVVEMKDPWLVSIQATQDDAVPLKEELAVLYIVLDGKSVDQDASEGSIVSLSKKYSKARIDPMPPVLSNIRLQLSHADPALCNEHIYAKVIQVDPDCEGCVTLRFTSVPSPICDYFKSLEC